MMSRDHVESIQMDSEEIAKISIHSFADELRKPEAVLFWQYLDETWAPSKCSQVCTKLGVTL